MKKEKLVYVVACLLIFLTLQSNVAYSQTPLPKNNLFTPILSRGEQYNKYIETTYESGLQKPKTSNIAVSYYSSYNTYYASNTSIQWHQVSAEFVVDLRKVKNILNTNDPSRNIGVFDVSGTFNFAGTNRNYQFSLIIYRNNDRLFFQYGRFYDTLIATYQTYNYTLDSTEMRYMYFEARIFVAMVYDPSTTRSYGQILVDTNFHNKTGSQMPDSSLTGPGFFTNGLWSTGNCFISYSLVRSYYYYGSTSNVWNIAQSNNVISYVRILRTLTQPQGNFLFPNPSSIMFDDWGQSELILDTNLETKPFWNYQSFNLEEKETTNITLSRNYTIYNETMKNQTENVYQFNYTFKSLKVVSRQEKYYYSTQTINPRDWGNWVFVMFKDTIVESTLDFNWVRDGFVFVVNSIIFLFQAVFYLLIIAFNYLIVWLLLQIIVLLWNYPIFWITFGFVGIVFYISFFFVWLWNQAIILWKMVIEPIVAWIVNWVIQNVWNPIVSFFRNGGLKTLFDFYMIILSYIIAFLLWVLTFGTQEFSTIQQSIQAILLSINSAIFEFLSVFFENFIWLMLSTFVYIMLIGLIYVKYIYAKSRGYIQRASRLQSMINVYKLPLVLAVRIVSYFIGFIQGGVPTDGLNE